MHQGASYSPTSQLPDGFQRITLDSCSSSWLREYRTATARYGLSLHTPYLDHSVTYALEQIPTELRFLSEALNPIHSDLDPASTLVAHVNLCIVGVTMAI